MHTTRQIVLDTETTGLDPKLGHRLIEIGCIEITDRKIHTKHFHRFINPERLIEEGALAVHGISNAFLADKPLFKDIVDEFLAFVQGAELIIHNAAFDVGFLNHELDDTWGPIERYCTITDTLAMARQMHPGQKNNLDALCKRYNVDNTKRERHGALLDAELLARVYFAMTGGQVSLFGEESINISTLADRVAVANSEFKKERPRLAQRVIIANAEEIAAHQAYLAFLSQAGNCIWSQEAELS